jgi:hypothetical protein
MEDIKETSKGNWSHARYELAARHLGSFNGHYLVNQSVPDFAWLALDVERVWSAEFSARLAPALDFIQRESTWAHPLTRGACTVQGVEPFLRVWQEQELYFDALSRMPQTFCHLDAHRLNLFSVDDPELGEQTVAIDWAFCGRGAVGSELGTFVLGAFCFFQMPVSDAEMLDARCFAAYLRGLDDVGCQYRSETVRLAYLIDSILRLGIVAPPWLMRAMHETDFEWVVEFWKHPRDEIISTFSGILGFLAKQAVEASELLKAFK